MKINRREFLILSAAFAAGCSSLGNAGGPAAPERVVNAGPIRSYSADGVYAAFRTQGFFIIRRGGQLIALSSICTHRHCLIETEPDRCFLCPCHGSTFDPNGHVTHGPARHDLPILETFTNEKSELLVRVRVA